MSSVLDVLNFIDFLSSDIHGDEQISCNLFNWDLELMLLMFCFWRLSPKNCIFIRREGGAEHIRVLKVINFRFGQRKRDCRWQPFIASTLSINLVVLFSTRIMDQQEEWIQMTVWGLQACGIRCMPSLSSSPRFPDALELSFFRLILSIFTASSLSPVSKLCFVLVDMSFILMVRESWLSLGEVRG